MSKVNSQDSRCAKEAYKTTLNTLLRLFEAPFSDQPEDHSCSSDSLIFEKDLQRLFAQNVFTLEIIRPTVYEILLSSRDYRTTATGFRRLTEECCRLLSRHHERIQLNERETEMHLRRPSTLEGIVSEYLTSDSIRHNSNREDTMVPPQNHIALTSSDDESKECVSGGNMRSDRSVHSKPLPRHILSTDLVEASSCLAGLITLTESQSFESLLTSVCFRRSRRRTTTRDLRLVILESILATNGLQDSDKTDFRNLSLAFGETPLVLAVRARDPDVVLALVRHGADVNRGWMGLRNALQVLLFSPNQIFLGPEDTEAIERCLSYLLMVTPTVDFDALACREREGYYGLHYDWKEALRTAMLGAWGTDSIPVPSLQHLCRCTVRTAMSHLGCRIVDGLHQLPLPVQLKRFIQL